MSILSTRMVLHKISLFMLASIFVSTGLLHGSYASSVTAAYYTPMFLNPSYPNSWYLNQNYPYLPGYLTYSNPGYQPGNNVIWSGQSFSCTNATNQPPLSTNILWLNQLAQTKTYVDIAFLLTATPYVTPVPITQAASSPNTTQPFNLIINSPILYYNNGITTQSFSLFPKLAAANTPLMEFNLQLNIIWGSTILYNFPTYWDRFSPSKWIEQSIPQPSDLYMNPIQVFVAETEGLLRSNGPQDPTSPIYNSAALTPWMVYMQFLLYFKQYLTAYQFMGTSYTGTSQLAPKSFTFSIPTTLTDATGGKAVANKAATYNNVTFTVGGTYLPLRPTLTVTFNQVRDTGTVTTSYTIDLNKACGMNLTNSYNDTNRGIIIFPNSVVSNTLDKFLLFFLTATSEPFLYYYALMWYVAQLQQMFPGDDVQNVPKTVTIPMTGYNTDLFLNAVPQLITDPEDVKIGRTPQDPILQLPNSAIGGTGYTNLAISLENDTSQAIEFNQLLIDYVGENNFSNMNYYRLLAQADPTTPIYVGSNLPAPYTNALVFQGSFTLPGSELNPQVYVSLPYIFISGSGGIVQPEPYITVDISQLTAQESSLLNSLINNFLSGQSNTTTNIFSIQTWYHMLAWYMITLNNNIALQQIIPPPAGFSSFLDTQGRAVSSIALPDNTTAFPTLTQVEATTLQGSILRGAPGQNAQTANKALGLPELTQATTTSEQLLANTLSTEINTNSTGSSTPITDFLTRLIALYAITQNTANRYPTITLNTVTLLPETESANDNLNKTIYYIRQFYSYPVLTKYLSTKFYKYPSPLDGTLQNSSFIKAFRTFNDGSAFVNPDAGSNALESIINDTALQYISALSYLVKTYTSLPTSNTRKPIVLNMINSIAQEFCYFYNYTLKTRYQALPGGFLPGGILIS